jgi:putative ABC transport system ATP-binding protein
MASGPVVSLRDVVFRHPGRDAFVLRVPRLELREGERVGCVGPSGSGKTTLVQLIAGVTRPSDGAVDVLGSSIASLPESACRAVRLARLGMVFQELELIEYLSTLENILLPVRLRGRTLTSEDLERAHNLARTMGVAPVLRRPPRRLSQGERQRAALCRALILSPSLILCDEPTGNLDPDNAERVLDLLFDYVSESGATLFMVTHNHGMLHRFDRVVDMLRLAEEPTIAGTAS